MFKTPKLPPPPPPPPAPKAIPTETDPSVRQAEVEAARKGRKNKGRSSTMLSGSLGDGDYAAPSTSSSTLLGG